MTEKFYVVTEFPSTALLCVAINLFFVETKFLSLLLVLCRDRVFECRDII